MSLLHGCIMIQVIFAFIVLPVVWKVFRGIGKDFLEVKLVVKSRDFIYYSWGIRRIILTGYLFVIVLYFLFTAGVAVFTPFEEWGTNQGLVFYFVPLLFLAVLSLLLCVLLGKSEESGFFRKPENKQLDASLKKYKKNIERSSGGD